MPIPTSLVLLVLCVYMRQRLLRRRRLLMQLVVLRRRRLARKRRHPGRLGSPPGRVWKVPRMTGVESVSLMMYLLHQPDPKRFLRNFRVDVGMFNLLVDELTPALAVNPRSFRRDEVHPTEVVAMALYSLGSPAEFRSIAHIARRGDTTVSKHMYRVCQAIVDRWGQRSANPVIRHATGPENCVIADRFYSERGLPGCLGGYDGKHWFCRAGHMAHKTSTSAPHQRALHLLGAGELGTMDCFKGPFRSISVLALVDIDLKFRDHSAFNCGSTVDGRAHAESQLKRDIDAGDWPPVDSPVTVTSPPIISASPVSHLHPLSLPPGAVPATDYWLFRRRCRFPGKSCHSEALPYQ
jgi:hypothetical protein